MILLNLTIILKKKTFKRIKIRKININTIKIKLRI